MLRDAMSNLIFKATKNWFRRKWEFRFVVKYFIVQISAVFFVLECHDLLNILKCVNLRMMRMFPTFVGDNHGDIFMRSTI